jgi:4-hydroxybenzoate polyprenyltransferase
MYISKNIFKKNYLSFSNFVSFLSVSSILIALIGFLLPYFTFLLYDIKIDFNLLLSSYLLTYSVYSLDKLSNIKEDTISLPERAEFITRHRNILTYITVASYIVALTLDLLKNTLALFVVLFPLCIGLIYSIKISNFRLKDIPALKNISIAVSWAVVATFLPLAVSSKSLTPVVLIFYFVFTKCLINTVLFDVRDVEGDNVNGVRTIPVILGLNKTKNLLLILNSTLIPWLTISYSQGFFHQYLFVLMFSIFYGYWYTTHFCKKDIKKGKSLDLLVDGEWIYIAIFAFFLLK